MIWCEKYPLTPKSINSSSSADWGQLTLSFQSSGLAEIRQTEYILYNLRGRLLTAQADKARVCGLLRVYAAQGAEDEAGKDFFADCDMWRNRPFGQDVHVLRGGARPAAARPRADRVLHFAPELQCVGIAFKIAAKTKNYMQITQNKGQVQSWSNRNICMQTRNQWENSCN